MTHLGKMKKIVKYPYQFNCTHSKFLKDIHTCLIKRVQGTMKSTIVP